METLRSLETFDGKLTSRETKLIISFQLRTVRMRGCTLYCQIFLHDQHIAYFNFASNDIWKDLEMSDLFIV